MKKSNHKHKPLQLRSFGYHRTRPQAEVALKKVKSAHKGLPLQVLEVNRKTPRMKKYCVGFYTKTQNKKSNA